MTDDRHTGLVAGANDLMTTDDTRPLIVCEVCGREITYHADCDFDEALLLVPRHAALVAALGTMVGEWRAAAALTADDVMRLVVEGMADEVAAALDGEPR